jgi:hypothetical protein
MRRYSVYLKTPDGFGKAFKMIEVRADDVDVDSTEGVAYWNFVNFSNDKGNSDGVTVAGIPFGNVDYIVSAE